MKEKKNIPAAQGGDYIVGAIALILFIIVGIAALFQLKEAGLFHAELAVLAIVIGLIAFWLGGIIVQANIARSTYILATIVLALCMVVIVLGLTVCWDYVKTILAL